MDIKKSAKAGQMVCGLQYFIQPSSIISVECMQSHGQRPGSDTKIHSKILSNEDAIAGYWPENTGPPQQSTNGGGDAWSNKSTSHLNRYYLLYLTAARLKAMAAMNRGLNLPAIQKIMNDFEKESSMMDMKEEMMSDAVDDVMDDEAEDEEEEGDKILRQVLDEIGVDLSQQVRTPIFLSGPLANEI